MLFVQRPSVAAGAHASVQRGLPPDILSRLALPGLDCDPVAFNALFARDVALPLALAAYTVTGGSPAVLPPGFAQTAQIQADGVALGAMTKPHPAVAAMIKNSNVFGLMGQNAATRTAFVSFRGTQDLSDWLQDLDAVPEDYAPIGGFGQVHDGFQDVYPLVRGGIAANLATACAGCDQILVTGHSLGAALCVLAAPDIFRNMPPNTPHRRLSQMEQPRLISKIALPPYPGPESARLQAKKNSFRAAHTRSRVVSETRVGDLRYDLATIRRACTRTRVGV